MHFLKESDNIMHQALIDNDILTIKEWGLWDKPDEGNLFPVLVKNFHKIDSDKYIAEGLKTCNFAVRVPKMSLDTSVLQRLSLATYSQNADNHVAIPLCQMGSTFWFGFSMFATFRPEAFLASLPFAVKQAAWNLLTPVELVAYASQSVKYFELQERRG